MKCDAKDYYDTELLLNKALHADWEQHMKKPKWLERQDKDVFRELNHFYPALVYGSDTAGVESVACLSKW